MVAKITIRPRAHARARLPHVRAGRQTFQWKCRNPGRTNAISIPAALVAPVSADQQAPTCSHLSSPGRRCGTPPESGPPSFDANDEHL